MKKLVTYIFWLIALISLVYTTKEIISFSKDIILLKGYQTEAIIKQEKMLHPVVKIANIQKNIVVYNAELDSFETRNATVSTATGFSIQYDPVANISFIITNDHFCNSVDSTSSLVVEGYDESFMGVSEQYISANVLYSDPGLDLCLVEAFGYIKPVEIAEYDSEPELFEKVFIVGGPSGNFPIIIDTYVSSFIPRDEVGLGDLYIEGNDFFIVSEQIFPGHSGSPVFNQEGKVIGVVFAAMETYGGISISHEDIFQLLFDYQNSI
jgi:S1-C subfamily serine protease